MTSIKDEIINIVFKEKIVSNILMKKMLAMHPGKKKEIRLAMTDLFEKGLILYTYRHGCSFIEKSFAAPVRISRHVVVKAPAFFFHPKPTDLVVKMNSGDSFGSGEHPTTRLAMRGLERVMEGANERGLPPHASMLDIGTGSGILAIAAAGFGIEKATGIDIDPCARFEAKKNVLLNGYEKKIVIDDRAIHDIDDAFFLIAANLRLPTIQHYGKMVFRLLNPRGFIVFSGIYDDESDKVKGMCDDAGMRLIWERSEMGWVGLVFQKRGRKRGRKRGKKNVA